MLDYKTIEEASRAEVMIQSFDNNQALTKREKRSIEMIQKRYSLHQNEFCTIAKV